MRLGGDRVIGTHYVDVLRLFEDDPGTDLVVLIGEPGGGLEYAAAEYAAPRCASPSSPTSRGPGQPAGCARWAMLARSSAKDERSRPLENKMKAFASAGIEVARLVTDIGRHRLPQAGAKPRRAEPATNARRSITTNTTRRADAENERWARSRGVDALVARQAHRSERPEKSSRGRRRRRVQSPCTPPPPQALRMLHCRSCLWESVRRQRLGSIVPAPPMWRLRMRGGKNLAGRTQADALIIRGSRR